MTCLSKCFYREDKIPGDGTCFLGLNGPMEVCSDHKEPTKIAPISFGYCHCGCGELAPIAKRTQTKKGWTKGLPIKFIQYHNNRMTNNPKWRGGKRKRADGYIDIKTPGHHRSGDNGYVLAHILIAEKALGRPLPPGVVVHHATDSKTSGPLVICQDENYHKLLHQRMRALRACGHAHYRKCVFCHNYDKPENLIIRKIGPKKTKHKIYHQDCATNYKRKPPGKT